MFLKFCKFLGKHQRWSLYNLMFKRDSSTCVFWWILQKLSEYLFYWTPGWLLLTFYCNGKNLIKKNLSDVSTIGCLVFFDIFLVMFFLNVYSWVYFSHWGCGVFFKYLESQNTRVLSQKLSTKPHTNFMLFSLRCSKIDILPMEKL